MNPPAGDCCVIQKKPSVAELEKALDEPRVEAETGRLTYTQS